MARRVLGWAGHPALGCGFRVCPVIVARQRLARRAKTEDRKTSGRGILSRLENRVKGCVKTDDHGRREDKTIHGPGFPGGNSPNEEHGFSSAVHSNSCEG